MLLCIRRLCSYLRRWWCDNRWRRRRRHRRSYSNERGRRLDFDWFRFHRLDFGLRRFYFLDTGFSFGQYSLHLRIVRIETNRLFQVFIRFRIVAQQVISAAAREPAIGRLGIEPDGLRTVGQALVMLAHQMIGAASGDVSFRQIGFEMYSLIAIL